ncbi:ABC transporter ATP-binding protein [Mobilicoccus pelagius]|uniref:Putative ABC transporter ATP-binding protein n=1 Tax=Mobilicoccus pelagius NBRC 104925 TaxID=1089455 RepID=H5UQT3_9MICO|nr:ABC transporter ATP-binding protein [Mobilicoccus pelagius]GAB48091.1 putative ABC transporter ATP-binding protein [Mobilicoccus pelagius NBRC 104925]
MTAPSPDDRDAVLDLADVRRTFGTHVALDGVHLRVRAGESLGLLGPNGAGKTTLLSLVTGLRRPDTGTVRLFGGSPRDPSTRAALGVTPQATSLPQALRVREVVALVAGHYPDPVPTPDLLDRFGLTRVADAQCGGLSGGQQRRLLVALALVGRPRLVVLDEPTTGLDLDARDVLWRELAGYHARGGTLLVTSHYLPDIETLTERLAVLVEGRLVADGPIGEIRGLARIARVRLRSDASEALLHDLPGVVEVVAADGPGARGTARSWEIRTRDGDATVRELASRGIPFADLDVRPAALEDAVRHLTGDPR